MEEFTIRESKRQHLLQKMEEAQQAASLLSKKVKMTPNDEDLQKIIEFKMQAREYAIQILMIPAETEEGKEIQQQVHHSLLKAIEKDLVKKTQLKKRLNELEPNN